MPDPPLVLLDACTVVSLYACRRMADILGATEGTVAIAELVAGEAQYVFRGGDGEDAREREPVDLRPLIASGRLIVISTDDESELLTFIDLTRELGDGEAMTAALSIHRRATVVTDDRKAERVLTGRGVPLRSTLDVIKVWADRRQIVATELRTILIDLRQRGTYEPRRQHPLRLWWDSVIGER
jgi:predicted nucleic acid-binding protein